MDYKGIHISSGKRPTVGKLIGVGATASAYDWEEGKIIKIFNKGFPADIITSEYYKAMAVKNMNFRKAKVYELIRLPESGSYGIVYEKLEGECLLDYALRTRDVDKTVDYLCSMHKAILACSIHMPGDFSSSGRAASATSTDTYTSAASAASTDTYTSAASAASSESYAAVPSVPSVLRSWIEASPQADSPATREMLRFLDTLPDADVLCHGDYHPGNVILTKDGPAVLDFMCVCRGEAIYDIARTAFLIGYTPESRPEVIPLKKMLMRAYLAGMGVTEAAIGRYLSLVIVARTGEVPDEHAAN